MSTKILVPAALAVCLGFSNWSAGADYRYLGELPVVKTAPAAAPVIEAAQSTNGGADAAGNAGKPSRESAPNSLGRLWSPSRSFKTGVGPANVFQLRDSAGG